MYACSFLNFDARFRQSCHNVISDMGLDFISTPRQVENGTLMFADSETDCRYAIYETGYIRRFIKRGYYTNQQDSSMWKGYQLNRQHKVDGRTVREPATTPDELLGKLVRAITHYRTEVAQRLVLVRG
jgi:hypothetical protein